MSNTIYLTTAIPYVNGPPHLGHAVELVEADVLARAARARGDTIRFLTGTDENAPKNVRAAEEAGIPVAELVARNAARFAELQAALAISNDDFIRTSTDARHRPGVERLWRACAAAGALYEGEYDGLYCAGCEAFVDAPCDEHPGGTERVTERNWFFRLSRFRDELVALVGGGALQIVPERRRNEVLAVLRDGLADVSVSRPAERTRGWGIPVPGDPSQTIYVWFDALANYLTADPVAWRAADERIHVIGKGILRFHAVYWPAFLFAAGEPAPTTIYVHEYVTTRSGKLSKSSGGGVPPVELVRRYGVDPVRWWLLRDGPHARDAELTEDALRARANELADTIGNLVSRTVALARRLGVTPPPAKAAPPLGGFEFRRAAAVVAGRAEAANAFASHAQPWALPPAEAAAVVTELARACAVIAAELRPLLPNAADRIDAALAQLDAAASRALFRKAA